MRKSHLILLIITLLMALFSAYSLAAINQVYRIDFSWYSQYYKKYISERREIVDDKWSLPEMPDGYKLEVIMDKKGLENLKAQGVKVENAVLGTDFNKYILIYCSLGKVYSPEYRIKATDIAQRGNIVEVRMSINSPAKPLAIEDDEGHEYLPDDFVRIEKAALPLRGKLYFIFKTQTGKQIGEIIRIVE